MDEIYNLYSYTTHNSKLNLEFILDESATPGMNRDCLIDKWRPWNSTFVSSRDNVDIFFSNDKSKGYDRFQYLNDPVPPRQETLLLARAKQIDFGKFKDIKNPILMWEPSQQNASKLLYYCKQ